MTIAVRAIIYHRKEQLEDIMRLTDELEPGSTLHVITNARHAKSLESNIRENNCSEECNNPPAIRDYDCDDEYIQIRGVYLDIDVVCDETDLAESLISKFDKETIGEDPETAVLEIDMSCATPWESVTVCKLSAAINIRMYTSRGDCRHIKSFPKHLDLDESELLILRLFRGRKNFTRDDVAKALRDTGLSASGTTVHRVIGSLGDKGCIIELRGSEYPGERSTHGGNRVKYYRVDKNSWMMERINERAVGKLSESVYSLVPGDEEKESYDERTDSNP